MSGSGGNRVPEIRFPIIRNVGAVFVEDTEIKMRFRRVQLGGAFIPAQRGTVVGWDLIN